MNTTPVRPAAPSPPPAAGTAAYVRGLKASLNRLDSSLKAGKTWMLDKAEILKEDALSDPTAAGLSALLGDLAREVGIWAFDIPAIQEAIDSSTLPASKTYSQTMPLLQARLDKCSADIATYSKQMQSPRLTASRERRLRILIFYSAVCRDIYRTILIPHLRQYYQDNR